MPDRKIEDELGFRCLLELGSVSIIIAYKDKFRFPTELKQNRQSPGKTYRRRQSFLRK